MVIRIRYDKMPNNSIKKPDEMIDDTEIKTRITIILVHINGLNLISKLYKQIIFLKELILPLSPASSHSVSLCVQVGLSLLESILGFLNLVKSKPTTHSISYPYLARPIVQ